MDTSKYVRRIDIEKYKLGREFNDVYRAVCSNDVYNLNLFIRKCSRNNTDYNDYDLLHVTVKQRKVDSFNYLISLEDIDLESHIIKEGTPLILSCQHADNYFAKRLIQRGADVNHCAVFGDSPLHFAVENCLETVEVLLENGADVNYMSFDSYTSYPRTPLEVACRDKNYNAIHLLLYYGAVVSLVPLSTVTEFMVEAPLDCLETLLLHYFNELDKVDLNFISVIVSRKFELFPDVLANIKEVDCDSGELNYKNCDLEQLIALLKKFPEFRKYFLRESLVWLYIFQDSASMERFTKLVLKLAEETLLFDDYLEIKPGVIAYIVACYREFDMDKGKLMELILILISYGVPVCIVDFLEVHSYFGNGLLVKLFLHNTIEKIPDERLVRGWSVWHSDLMSVLLYRPNFDFNCNFATHYWNYYYYDSLNDVKFKYLNPISAFRYFANSKFRKFISKVYPRNIRIYELVQKQQFPKLTELSRNACQSFIYSKYKISHENPGRYYDIVKRLPVHNYCKQILTFDVELYSV